MIGQSLTFSIQNLDSNPFKESIAKDRFISLKDLRFDLDQKPSLPHSFNNENINYSHMLR